MICAVFLLFLIFFRVYIQNKSGKCVGVFLQFQVFLSTEVIRYIELQITYITVSHLKALFCWLIPHDVNKIISWWFQIKKKIRRLNYENNFGVFWGGRVRRSFVFPFICNSRCLVVLWVKLQKPRSCVKVDFLLKSGKFRTKAETLQSLTGNGAVSIWMEYCRKGRNIIYS